MKHFNRNARMLFGSVAFVGAIAALTPPADAAVIFVNAELTTGANDGTSWPNAFQGRLAVQSALVLAQPGDELWVAQGTYAPAPPNGPTTISLVIPSGVALLGGFVGTETSADHRNPAAHPTILTADLNSDDLSHVFATLDDNSDHVVRFNNAGTTTLLDGFTIERGTGGEFSFDNPGSGTGGGVLILAGAPTIRACHFRDNGQFKMLEGAGISALNAAPLIEDCSFVGNRAGTGANISSRAGSNTTVRRCTFVEADIQTGGINGMGIASGINYIGDLDFTSHLTVEDCLFSMQCQIATNGVGIRIGGGTADIRRSRFIRNTSGGNAGALRATAAAVTIDRCLFVGNEGTADGGAAIVVESLCPGLRITNSLFTGNGRTGGGATLITQAPAQIINCTAWNDGNPSQVFSFLGTIGPVHISNSIVWDIQSTLEPIDAFGTTFFAGTITASRCLIEGWASQFPGIGNSNANPQFVDADGPDNIPGSIDDDLRLSPNSPAIDRGDNSFLPAGIALDFTNCPRFADDPSTPDTGAPIGALIVDAGAHEFLFPCPGDASTDLMVGLPDIAAIIQTWNSTDEIICARIDLDHSGVIGLGDIARVIQHWGSSCN